MIIEIGEDRLEYLLQQIYLYLQADLTTNEITFLAKNLDMLRHLRSKVMVCEEAGEMLEAHTLTALSPSVEHAILIGDHQQF